MFRFEHPAAFFWLWLIPVVWVVIFLWSRRRERALRRGWGERLTPFLSRSVSERKRRWKAVLQTLTVIFAIVAWARPQMGESKQEIRSEGVEILFAVDVSESMMAEDVKPNRLAQAKAELSRLMDMMPGNKTGVIAFAGSAALLSPLTNDPAAVKMYLDSLATTSISTQGTCFECALKTAEDAFERGGAATEDGVGVTRVILVVSDGEDHESGALAAAQALAGKGILIFSLAYGTEKGGPIPVRDGMGYLRGYKRDRGGQTVISQVKGDALKALAAAGQGSFEFSTFGGDHLRRIVSRIDRLEKTQFESQIATQYDERYQFFLLLAVICALADLMLGERRKDFRLWRGRFEVPPA